MTNIYKKRTGAKNENRGMTSSRSIGAVSSDSGWMKTFFTTGIGPWTSYKPILWLNVANPKSDPGPRAVMKVKRSSTFKHHAIDYELHGNYLRNYQPSKAASRALLISSRNSSEAAHVCMSETKNIRTNKKHRKFYTCIVPCVRYILNHQNFTYISDMFQTVLFTSA